MRGTGKILPAAVTSLALLASACGAPQATSPTTTTTYRPPVAAVATTSFVRAGCTGGSGLITQAMDGRITACVRAGALGAGGYHVSLQQVVGTNVAVGGTSVNTGPDVGLSLSPAGGAPGTTVTITGKMASPPRPLPQHANFCWDGCPNGLQYGGVQLRWTGPNVFTAKLVVPAAPWVESNPVRVVDPHQAEFSIGVNCLVLTRGCGLGGAEGSARFRMTGVKKLAWCPSVANCASLAAGPARVLPGQIIKVQGYAPLVSVIGSDQPFAFQLQVSPGLPHGSTVELKTLAKGGTEAFFGQAPVEIRRAPSFASLGHLAPETATLGGPGAINANPADPTQVAWCAGTHLGATAPSGTVQIRTAAAVGLLTSLGYGFMGAPAPNCAAIAPLPGYPATPPAVAAAFTVSQGNSAPPVYDVALYTSDGGATWSPVPPPQGSPPTAFGGFRFSGDSLQALYGVGNAPAAGGPMAVATTELQGPDAGWRNGTLTCPSSGPCATLGPYEPGNCAMNGTSQLVLYSSSQGVNWKAPDWPQSLSTCASAELANIGGGRLLAVDSESEYPVRLSTDGGRSWSFVALPALPRSLVGNSGGSGLGSAAGQLILLPTGALLAYGVGTSQTNALLLAPGKTAWCQVPSSVPLPTAAFGASIGLAGVSFWWVAFGRQAAPPTPHQVALSQIAC